ncbi:hypothetical protein OIU84_029176 [Salix udensis]|uniref:Uncharacterized protein n=1 Tax=Salix udensis TaxID=889485 RepID=A0AAD6K8P2_9ROSI|nr:hypothetical protein OIU84_029176 [Salix udensis]
MSLAREYAGLARILPVLIETVNILGHVSSTAGQCTGQLVALPRQSICTSCLQPLMGSLSRNSFLHGQRFVGLRYSLIDVSRALHSYLSQCSNGMLMSPLCTLSALSNSQILKFERAESLKMELMKTPFWTLIDSILEGTIDKQTCRKSDLFVCQILQTYNKDEEVFRINDENIKIYAQDIKLIFGITDGNIQIDVNKYKAEKQDRF